MIFAGSLVLSCVRGASLEQTLVEDSLLATSMPATPVTEVQPEDHRNALDRSVLQRTPALTETDALTLLLDAPDAILAGELLAEFGSLTGLARATVANLRRVLPETKAARLVAALRLATLAAAMIFPLKILRNCAVATGS
jgi:hypothetical protein